MYYAITGRKGLSLYEKDGSAVITCKHPSLKNVELVFPEIGQTSYRLSTNILSMLIAQGKEVRLARHMKEDLLNLNNVLSRETKTNNPLKVYQEDVMDWAYPVHIVSTEKVSRRSGDKFQNLRTDCNNFEKQCPDYALIPIQNVDQPYKMMRYVLKTWEAQMIWRDKDDIDFEDYYNALFMLAVKNPKHIDGFILFDKEFPIAISLWDPPNNKQIVGLSNICNTMYRGLSSFLMAKTCEVLFDQGVEFVNMGGSETKDLDAFKTQRLRPVKSLDIYSAHVNIDQTSIFDITKLGVPKYLLLSPAPASYEH